MVNRNGKSVAAMVPIEDLQRLAELEDEQDIVIANQRFENPEERLWSLEEIIKGGDLED